MRRCIVGPVEAEPLVVTTDLICVASIRYSTLVIAY